MRWLGSWTASWLVVLLSTGVAAQQRAVEVRAEREQGEPEREPEQESPRVYTNEDLSSTRGRISVVGKPAASRPTSPPASAEESAQRAEERAKEEEAWRRRGRERRRAIAYAEQRLARLEAQVREIESQLDIAFGVAMQALMGQLQRAEQARDRVAVELAESRSDLEELRREARRAGVPPGWLRNFD